MEQKEIVLGRVGHYFDAGNGSCSTALIVDAPSQETVNVAGWNQGGTAFSRTSVPVDATPDTEADRANSFHLTRDCPWGR